MMGPATSKNGPCQPAQTDHQHEPQNQEEIQSDVVLHCIVVASVRSGWPVHGWRSCPYSS